MKKIKGLWIWVFFICLATPAGLMAGGDAWGEWGRDFFQKVLGFVPEGIAKYSGAWHAPFRDYNIPGFGEVTGYILSAIAGIGLIMGAVWLLARGLSGKNGPQD